MSDPEIIDFTCQPAAILRHMVYATKNVVPTRTGVSNPLLLCVQGKPWGMGYYRPAGQDGSTAAFFVVDMDGRHRAWKVDWWAYLNE